MADTLQEFIASFEAQAEEAEKNENAEGTDGNGEGTDKGGKAKGEGARGDAAGGGDKARKPAGGNGTGKDTGADGDAGKPAAEGSDPDGDGSPDGAAEPGESDDDDPARLKQELKRAKKRFKDTQANWTKEHQARLDLEKRLTELEKKKDTPAPAAEKKETTDGDGWGIDGQDGSPDNDTELVKEIKAMRQELQEVRRREKLAAWTAAEAKVEKENADYREVVYDVFQPEVERNEKLMQEFREKGATPEAAYEMGQRLIEEQIGKLPKALRERIKPATDTGNKNDDDDGTTEGDDDGEPGGKAEKPVPPVKRRPSTLDDLPGDRGGSRGPGCEADDLLDSVLGSIRPGRKRD